ncbi:unnamed protein product [Effrenium voratum]|nr:unnamed protein product [Effrenium voratum]
MVSHRTGKTTEEVEQWADPEESAKEVEELRRVRRQIRYIFGGMLQSLPEAGTLRVDDLISDAGTEMLMQQARLAEKPPAMPGTKTREAYQKVPLPPQTKPEGHGRPRSGGTEMSSVTGSSAVSYDSQATDDERRKEKKERKSRKHRHEARDARPAKKDDGASPKPYNWAEEVVKASLDPQNQWEFPSQKAGYVGQLAAWEQPRARGSEVASRARERAEEVQRWERERHHDAQSQQYIFGTPRGY